MTSHIQQIALIGTDRAPQLPPQPDWMPDPPEADDPATHLLHRLSMARAAERAGQRAQPVADLQLPQPIEEGSPYCSPLAVQLWRDIVELESKFPVFEQRWLDLCAQRGQVLAPEILVEVFHYCTPKRMAVLRPYAARVAGARGTWLAQQYEKWKFALATNYLDLWRTGKPTERTDALVAARIFAPDTAQLMLRSTWEKETPADRRKFVDLLLPELAPTDAPLLQFLLDTITAKPGHNKTMAIQETKRILVSLLLALPESTLAIEWTALLSTYFKGGQLQLPSTDDAFFHPERMVDLLGFDPKLPIEVWFSNLSPIVPPNIWQKAAQAAPSAVFEAIFEKKYNYAISKVEILGHFVQGTIRTKNTEWAELLLFKGINTQTIELMAALPPERRETLLMEGNISPAAQQLVWGSPVLHFPWSAAFSHWALRELYQSWVGYFFSKVQQIMPLDVFLHPDTRPESIPGLYDRPDSRERWLQQIVPELDKTLAVSRVFAKMGQGATTPAPTADGN